MPLGQPPESSNGGLVLKSLTACTASQGRRQSAPHFANPQVVLLSPGDLYCSRRGGGRGEQEGRGGAGKREGEEVVVPLENSWLFTCFLLASS